MKNSPTFAVLFTKKEQFYLNYANHTTIGEKGAKNLEI
jgi:hypothetical protein